VALYLADLAVIAVLVGAGCGLSHFLLRRTLRRTVAERQLATERQLRALAVTLKALEARVAGLSQIPELQAAAAPVIDMEAAAPGAKQADHPENEEVTPEILAVIAAAANAFLGQEVRILSARMLETPHEVVSPWSQQGRVFVQASHNLRARG
jgi:hypothetical protein